jgi:16S rRNA (uracil1498-N3)-methyltransferase
MPQFYCPNLIADIVELDAEETHHVYGSRRIRAGQRIRLFDGRGTLAEGTVVVDLSEKTRAIRDAEGIRVQVDNILQLPRPSRSLTLVMAAPKGDRLEWVIEKCTELGVSRIVLARFERSVVEPRETRLEKLSRISREACKQCGRAWLPEISIATIADAIRGGSNRELPDSALLLADPAAHATWFGPWLGGRPSLNGPLTLVIGPEGGCTPDEEVYLRECRAAHVRLADATLRIETAAVAGAAVWAAAGCDSRALAPGEI